MTARGHPVVAGTVRDPGEEGEQAQPPVTAGTGREMYGGRCQAREPGQG
jgi:hypothetical protein